MEPEDIRRELDDLKRQVQSKPSRSFVVASSVVTSLVVIVLLVVVVVMMFTMMHKMHNWRGHIHGFGQGKHIEPPQKQPPPPLKESVPSVPQ